MKFPSKYIPLFAATLVLSACAGCAMLDSLLLPPVGPDGVPTGPSVIDQIGAGARSLIPGWGTIAGVVLTGVGWLYTSIRSKKRESAVSALIVDVVQFVIAAKGGTLDYDAMWNTLEGAKTLFANKDKFIKLVNDIRDAVHNELADGFQPEDLVRIAAAVKKDFDDVTDIKPPGA
jgi:hypothetical protein